MIQTKTHKDRYNEPCWYLVMALTCQYLRLVEFCCCWRGSLHQLPMVYARRLSLAREKLVHGTLVYADNIIKIIVKLFVCIHAKYITSKRFKGADNVCLSISTINSWCIRLDGISDNSFLLTVDTGNGKLRLGVLGEMHTCGHTSILCCGSKCVFAFVNGLPWQMRNVLCEVRQMGLHIVCLWSQWSFGRNFNASISVVDSIT